jgi:hypothetical protein
VFESQVPEVKPNGDVQMESEYRPVGGDAVQWEALHAAGKKVDAPVLKAFERLSLLQ